MAQSFYIRLITLVDDFGRCDGRASVLWGQLFSVWNDKNPDNAVNPQQVAQMLQECAADSARLIELYEVDGKKVVQVTQWHERIREGAKEKWPANLNPQRIPADSCGFLPPSPPPSPLPPSPSPNIASEQRTSPSPSSPPPAPPPVVVEKVNPYDELRAKLEKMYQRAPGARWSNIEESALSEISRARTDALNEIKRLEEFKAKEPRYPTFPDSVARLLRDWEETLDRAGNYKESDGAKQIKKPDYKNGF